MCGFFCAIAKDHPFKEDDFLKSFRNSDLLTQRGPDEQGFYRHPHHFCFHSRLQTLSLLDEDNLDKQPLVRGEDYLLFNGDIYNYRDFSPTMKNGDTSALFTLLQKKSIAALNDLNGNFALCYKEGERLFLARDRMGIRPLFYTLLESLEKPMVAASTNLFILAELRKKHHHELTLNNDFFSQYHTLRYGASVRESVFHEIHAVAPGHFIEINLNDLLIEKRVNLKEVTYWDINSISRATGEVSGEACEDELATLLKDAIEIRTQTHGHEFSTFLSGGIDSGLISALASKKSGFKESLYMSLPGSSNEDERLNRFQKSYDLPLRKITYNPHKDLKVFDALEQPYGDTIIFLVDQLCKEAAKSSRVVLSGDGADEVFGGYVHHRVFFMAQVFNKALPGLGRSAVLKLMGSLPTSFWNTFFPYNQGLDQKGIQKFIKFLHSFENPLKAYLSLVSLGSEKEEEAVCSQLDREWPRSTSFSMHELLRFDLKFWSPQYALYKMDRIGFSRGLDIRVPFFDHRLVEWSLRHHELNPCQNLSGAKVQLRKAVAKHGLLKDELWKEKKFPFRLSEKDGGLYEGKRKVVREHEQQWHRVYKERIN